MRTKDIFEATLPKVPKVPILKPGTSKELPSFSKFGKIYRDLEVIRSDLEYYKSFPSEIPNQKAHQQRISKEKKLAKSVTPDKAKKILDYINTHCGKYVKDMQATGKLLYRGIKDDESQSRTAFIGNSRIKRKPKDSNKQASNEFNKILTKLGIEANRSNSIFTTSQSARTGQFGQRYIIFPLDSAKFSWTTEADIVLNSNSSNIWTEYTTGDKQIDAEILEELTKDFAPRIKKANEVFRDKFDENEKSYYLITNILYRLRQDLEYINRLDKETLLTMIHRIDGFTDVYRNKPEFKDVMELYDYIKIRLPKIKKKLNLEKFKERYDPKDTDFAAALQSHNEICVSGYYLALKEVAYRSFIMSEILGKRD